VVSWSPVTVRREHDDYPDDDGGRITTDKSRHDVTTSERGNWGFGTQMCGSGVRLGEDKVDFPFSYLFFLFVRTLLNLVSHMNQDFHDVF
jgi:hypothetical protein